MIFGTQVSKQLEIFSTFINIYIFINTQALENTQAQYGQAK